MCLLGAHEDDFLRLNELVAPREGTKLAAEDVREDIEGLMAPGYVKDVVALVEPLDGGRVVLVYAVTPYERVGSVALEGVTALAHEDVDEVAKVGLPASPLMLHAVSGSLRASYERHGYPRARVDARLAPAKPGYPALVLTVDEGPRLALATITFPGAKQVPEAELRKAIKSAPGQAYASPVVELDALTLTHVYYDRGFVNATVKTEPPREVNGGLELAFTIDEGVQFRVGTVKEKGDVLGPEKKLLAGLKVRTNAVFSRAAVREDLDHLQALGKQRGLDLLVTPVTNVNVDRRRVDLSFELELQK